MEQGRKGIAPLPIRFWNLLTVTPRAQQVVGDFDSSALTSSRCWVLSGLVVFAPTEYLDGEDDQHDTGKQCEETEE